MYFQTKQRFSSSEPDTHAQSQIMPAELICMYHTNNHTLSWCFLDCSINLSKVTFPDSMVETREEEREIFDKCVGPFQHEVDYLIM